MTQREVLDYQIAALRALPDVDAVGVGGGFGRGDADELSDVDLFVVSSDNDLWPLIGSFLDRVDHPLEVVSAGRGRFMSDYGYRFAFLLEGGLKVEYFLNSPGSMTPYPLSARMTVAWDRSGWLTHYLDDATRRHESDPGDAFAFGVHECLVDLHDLRKHVVRGEHVAAVWRLHTLRRTVMALNAMQQRSDVYAPSSSISRLRTRTTPGLASVVAQTTALATAESVLHAFETLRALMLDAWTGPHIEGVVTAAQAQLERELFEAIVGALRSA